MNSNIPGIPIHKHANGVAASDMLKLHNIPLYSVNGFAINNGHLEITGLALPPLVGKKDVILHGDSGCKFTFEYPLENKGAADFYWYWPGADKSAFRIRVDLANTKHDGRFFRFAFEFAGMHQDAIEETRATFFVPKDISLLQNFPDANSLVRVQRFETVSSVATRGISDARRICEISRYHGLDLNSGDVLDWGIGHGRVARYLTEFANFDSIHGIDIDPENAAWANLNLPNIRSVHGPLMPPTKFENNSFNLVYGISVMTHLPENVQRAWLQEINRILKPGGIALLTFAGDASVAFSSRYVDSKWMAEYITTGRAPDLVDRSLVGVIDQHDYYKNVKIRLNLVERMCADYMKVPASYACMFGYQDLVVLQK